MYILFYPSFDESELTLIGNYNWKAISPGMVDVVNRNRQTLEPASGIVDLYWIQCQNWKKTECCLYFTTTGRSCTLET